MHTMEAIAHKYFHCRWTNKDPGTSFPLNGEFAHTYCIAGNGGQLNGNHPTKRVWQWLSSLNLMGEAWLCGVSF